MKNIKDITISIFAIIGFVAIVSGFTNNETENQQTYGTPESHVWELQTANSNAGVSGGRTYLVNKVTGEVRKYNRAEPKGANAYIVMKESQGRN